MEIDNTIIKVQDNNEQDSERMGSDFIPSKSTSKLIKNCLKCLAALVLHVENAISKSNDVIFANNSSIVKSNDGSDIDIVEHSVKPDPDDATRYLRSIKKSILQLCFLCLEQNICVDYDLSYNKIDFYDCLEDSTRSLVINYLTENVCYLIEHIGFIISMFKQEKDREEAKDIRKSLQKIYKQILLIPLNPNLDETPDDFKNLDSSQWYTESMQHLGEKLCILRTALIKLRKLFKNRIYDSDNAAKRKTDNGANQSATKLESNGLYSPDNLFRIPDIPPPHKSEVITVESDTERKLTKKHKDASETNGNAVAGVVRIENDDDNVKKKKKHKITSEMNEINEAKNENDIESVKKKKKHKIKTEINENNVTIESDTESVKLKKKRKLKEYIETIESDTESVKFKKKHKAESDENIETIESDTESIKKKNKHKAESDENNSVIEIDTEYLKNKKKPKQKLETNGYSGSPDISEGFIEKDTIFKRKDKHHKHKDQETNNRKKDRSKTLSESSNISIGQLFTSQLEIGDDEISINRTSEKSPKKNKPGDITQDLGDYLNNYDLQRSKNLKHKKKHSLKDKDEDIAHEIFSALSKGELEVDYEDNAENMYENIIKENDLNENEKFLYLQDLILDAKEKKNIIPEKKKKLQELNILIDWEIPAIHEVERRLTAGPLPEELEELKRLGVCNERFHKEDDLKIHKNWKEFCRLYDLDGDPMPFLMLRHGQSKTRQILKYEERKKFIQFLGKGLNNRTLHSIYRRFKVLYSNLKNGRFSREEDELILTYCKKVNKQKFRFSALANILKRTRWSIEGRHRILTRQSNEKIKWTIELESKLIQSLLKSIGSKDVQDLIHTKLNSRNYAQAAREMQIPNEKVRHQWLKSVYTKLFAAEMLNTGKIRYKLIQMMIDSGITDYTKINWNEIATHFKGVSKEFLEYQFMIAQNLYIPKLEPRDLGKDLKLFDEYIHRQKEAGKTPFGNNFKLRYRMTEAGLEAYK